MIKLNKYTQKPIKTKSYNLNNYNSEMRVIR